MTVTRYKDSQDAGHGGGSDQVAIAQSSREAGHPPDRSQTCLNSATGATSLSLSLLSQRLSPPSSLADVCTIIWMDWCEFCVQAYHSILREQPYEGYDRTGSVGHFYHAHPPTKTPFVGNTTIMSGSRFLLTRDIRMTPSHFHRLPGSEMRIVLGRKRFQ